MLQFNLNRDPEPPLTADNVYTWMQKRQYDHLGSMVWDREYSADGDILFSRVDGRFYVHCNWDGYENLFKSIPYVDDWKVLDFGSGLGKNIICYQNRFKQIDGVDICPRIIDSSKVLLKKNQIDNCQLLLCNGIDLSEIPDETYDLIISTRCLQHICVYSIRYNYFEEFYRVLKPGGYISLQMSFGRSKRNQVGYYRNHWNASGTNGIWDVCVKQPNYIKADLKTFIGFKNFEYNIVLAPPYGVSGDRFYIFFRAQKPL